MTAQQFSVPPGRPPRRQWRVLVLSASMALMVAPVRRSRHDGTYVEVLDDLLRDAGHDVEVQNSSRPFDQIHQGARRFIEEEWQDFPDVLVVHFGFNECRPRVVPWVFLRHLHKIYRNLSAPALAYRKRVAPHLWRMTRSYQTVASAALGQRTWRMSPERYTREFNRLVTLARHEKMLVLVPDINPPGERILQIVPGLAERCDRYRQLQADLVAGFADDDVRLVPVSKMIDEMGAVAGLPDSLHFSAEAHVRLAEMLAAEIGPWLSAQAAEPGGSRTG